MKTVVLILDGAADHAVDALGGETPLEAAYIPNMAFMAQRGRTYLVDAVFDDLPVGSIVAALAILGYSPHRHYPNGRASFEASAGGIRLGPNDVAFRCNLISVKDGRIEDFTAGLVEDAVARSLVLNLTLPGPAFALFPGQSYRNTLVYRNAAVPASAFECAPPHENRGKRIADLWVRARLPEAEPIAAEVNAFLADSARQLARLNEEFNSRADMLWVWDPSYPPALPSFRSMHGVRGAVVSGLDFLRGIGMAAQMLSPEIPGATGYIGSNLRGKAQAAMDLLREVDVVCVHVNAADEEGHQRNVAGKVRAIELADDEVVGPLVRHLRQNYPGAYRIAVLPDHYTCVADGRHIVHPTPCLVFGAGITADRAVRFSEREIAANGSGRIPAWQLMPLLRA